MNVIFIIRKEEPTVLGRRASYDKKTLARQVIPLAPGYRQHFRRALIMPSDYDLKFSA